MLHPQPCRKAGVDDQSGWRSAGVPHEEILHRRQLAQSLSYRHARHHQHKTHRQRPQHVYPTPANPNLGHHANLGRQPVVQANTIVRRAEARLDWIVRKRDRVSARHSSISSALIWFAAFY